MTQDLLNDSMRSVAIDSQRQYTDLSYCYIFKMPIL